MISDEHAEALRAGRARRLAEDNAARDLAHAAYSAWVKEDSRLWRIYTGLDVTDAGFLRARDLCRANAALMPSISWARGE